MKMSKRREIVVSVDQSFVGRLDLWCKSQPSMPARSEAIRQLAYEALLLSEVMIRLESKA
jgi:metal-responsive CopG/Arc/MetJ family transcriptional regulator